MIAVRRITSSDTDLVANYWSQADEAFLKGMGADINLVPSREALKNMLSTQIGQDFPEKQAYCLIWLIDGKPVGHCNVNKIRFGENASMHLHLWDQSTRRRGFGMELVKECLPYFFKDLQLKMLYCEPYALNQAPNKTLEKVGFKFVREYMTIPGSLNFEQPVNRWEMSRELFEQLFRNA